MSNNNTNTFSAKPIFADIRNYLAGRFVGSTREEFFLEELVKLLFCKYAFVRGIEQYNPDSQSHSYRSCFRKMVQAYPEIFVKDSEIELDAQSIEFVNQQLSKLDLLNVERDVIGDAYEAFMGSAEDSFPFSG